MTIKELVSLTGISETEIETYRRCGLIGRKSDCEALFDGNDAKKIGLIRRLEQFGLSDREIEKFFFHLQNGETDKAVKILQKLRESIMRAIHEKQKSLDILDCIICETKNKIGGV